jgi:spore germination protein YaaH
MEAQIELTAPAGRARVNELLRHLIRIVLLPVVLAGWLGAAQKPEPESKAVAKPELDLAVRKMRWRVFGRRPLGMYYYTPDGRGIESLKKNAAKMNVLAPQCFKVHPDGVVEGTIPPAVMEIARRENLPLMPLLINPRFDRGIASALLRNPKAQERAVMYMAHIAKRDNYVGWQLDLEFIDPADKDLYTQFASRLAARLHRDGRLVSVAVVPRFSDTFPGTNPSREFRTGQWGAPYDYRALGRIADFVTVLAYDHHNQSSPPGPVAGYPWVKAALDYAVKRVPRQKLVLGIPLYGREWIAAAGGTKSRSMGHSELSTLLARPEIQIQRHKRWRVPWFRYREGETARTVWFDDSRSMNEKLGLVVEYRLRGFAAWRLGGESPEFWDLVAEIEKTQAAARTKKRQKQNTPFGSARKRAVRGALPQRANSIITGYQTE